MRSRPPTLRPRWGCRRRCWPSCRSSAAFRPKQQSEFRQQRKLERGPVGGVGGPPPGPPPSGVSGSSSSSSSTDSSSSASSLLSSLETDLTNLLAALESSSSSSSASTTSAASSSSTASSASSSSALSEIVSDVAKLSAALNAYLENILSADELDFVGLLGLVRLAGFGRLAKPRVVERKLGFRQFVEFDQFGIQLFRAACRRPPAAGSKLVKMANGEYTAASVKSDQEDALKLGLVKEKDGNYGTTQPTTS